MAAVMHTGIDAVNLLGRTVAAVAKTVIDHRLIVAEEPVLSDLCIELAFVLVQAVDGDGTTRRADIDALLAELPVLDGGLGSAVAP